MSEFQPVPCKAIVNACPDGLWIAGISVWPPQLQSADCPLGVHEAYAVPAALYKAVERLVKVHREIDAMGSQLEPYDPAMDGLLTLWPVTL